MRMYVDAVGVPSIISTDFDQLVSLRDIFISPSEDMYEDDPLVPSLDPLY